MIHFRIENIEGVPYRVAATLTMAGIKLQLAMPVSVSNDQVLATNLKAADEWTGFDPIFPLLTEGISLFMGRFPTEARFA